MSIVLARQLATELERSGWTGRGAVAFVPLQEEAPLYRLVRSDPPRARDFQSHYERGVILRHLASIQMGLSMMDSAAGAGLRALKRPAYVARVQLRPENGLAVAKTLGPGHYTVWGHPDVLLDLVEQVQLIDPAGPSR